MKLLAGILMTALITTSASAEECYQGATAVLSSHDRGTIFVSVRSAMGVIVKTLEANKGSEKNIKRAIQMAKDNKTDIQVCIDEHHVVTAMPVSSALRQ